MQDSALQAQTVEKGALRSSVRVAKFVQFSIECVETSWNNMYPRSTYVTSLLFPESQHKMIRREVKAMSKQR